MLSTKLKKATKEFLIENLESALSNLLMNRKRVDVEIIEHILATVESAKLLQESMPVGSWGQTRANSYQLRMYAKNSTVF